MRALSKVAPRWWDYTTLDEEILDDAARLTAEDLLQLSRPGFTVKFYDTLASFYTAEALEYVRAWQQSTESEPAGICGPIGPTEQLPLVAQIVNDLEIDVRSGHFWAMDEWYIDGKEAPLDHPLSFARVDLELCFRRIDKRLRMADENLHPMTLIQNARTSGGGVVTAVPSRAISVGPVETWKSQKVSIWHAGTHDNPFGQRLTAFMISKKIPDSAVPMSLLADHPDVQFNYFRGGIGTCAAEMH